MKKDFKFPPTNTSAPPVPSPPKPSTIDEESRESPTKGTPQEVPPPPPVEKERAPPQEDSEDADDDVGPTVEVDLS